jgi:hypothetical protein
MIEMKAGLFLLLLFGVAAIVLSFKFFDKKTQVLNEDEEYCASCGKLKKKNKRCEYCNYV